jgi:cytochrome c oxidase subunit 3
MAHFRKNHPFHLVTPSHWPIVVSTLVAVTGLSLISCFWFDSSSNSSGWHPKYGLYLGLTGLIMAVLGWFNDLIHELTGSQSMKSYSPSESTNTQSRSADRNSSELSVATVDFGTNQNRRVLNRPHGNILNEAVEHNIMNGMILFLASEVMLFFSFFWAFFNTSLSPSIFFGNVWPPKGLTPVAPFEAPLLNTVLLLSSGVTVNAFYYNLKGLRSLSSYVSRPLEYNQSTKDPRSTTPVRRDDTTSVHVAETTLRWLQKKPTTCTIYSAVMAKWQSIYANLSWTLVFGLIFMFIQLYEFIHANFTISDGAFGSTFYMLTGLHGLHVCLGLALLIYSGFRLIRGDFDLQSAPHLGVTCSVIYWHYVDLIWILVFILVYVGTGSAVN